MATTRSPRRKRLPLTIEAEASDICAVIIEGVSRSHPQGQHRCVGVMTRRSATTFANSFNSINAGYMGATARVEPVTWKLAKGGAK